MAFTGDGQAMSWLTALVVPRHDSAAELRRDGQLASVLYLVAAGNALLVLVQVPVHRPQQTLLAGVIITLGIVQFVLPWQRLPRVVLHLPMGLALVFLSLAYGAWLGDLVHWSPGYVLSFGYAGLVLGPGAGARWACAALGGLGAAVLFGHQHDYVTQMVAIVAVSALLGELVAASVSIQRRHALELRSLNTSLSGLLGARELSEAATLMSRRAAELLHADGALLLIRDEPGSSRFVSEGGSDPTPLVRGALTTIDIAAEATAAGHAISTATMLFIPDIVTNRLMTQTETAQLAVIAAPSTASGPDAPAGRGRLSSILYLPILGHDEVIGVMLIWWLRPHRSLDAFAEQVTQLLSVQAAPILERLQRLQDLDQAALTDSLTGVRNRRAFDLALTHLPPDAAVIMCDLDRFKNLNDTQGHSAGDRVLRQFAAIAAAAVRSGDLVARIGGDEFAFITPGGSAAAEAVLRRMRQEWPDPEGVGFSAGSAVRNADEDAAALCRRADQALYIDKRSSGERRRASHT